MTDSACDRDAPVPNDGPGVRVVLGDWSRFVCWGTAGDVDRVITVYGQVLTWATPDDACRRVTREAG